MLETAPTAVITKGEFEKLPRYDYDVDRDNILYSNFFDNKQGFDYCKFETYEGLCKAGTKNELVFGRQISKDGFYDGQFENGSAPNSLVYVNFGQ